ncbi:30920_t:CDS:2, partial [Racocetra persica]
MISHIIKGEREKVIQETPIIYSKLYQRCWQDDPDKRPNCKVLRILKNVDMKSLIQIYTGSLSITLCGLRVVCQRIGKAEEQGKNAS